MNKPTKIINYSKSIIKNSFLILDYYFSQIKKHKNDSLSHSNKSTRKSTINQVV